MIAATPKRHSATLILISTVKRGFMMKPSDHTRAQSVRLRHTSCRTDKPPFTGASARHWRPRNAFGGPMSPPVVPPPARLRRLQRRLGHRLRLRPAGCPHCERGPTRGSQSDNAGPISAKSRDLGIWKRPAGGEGGCMTVHCCTRGTFSKGF